MSDWPAELDSHYTRGNDAFAADDFAGAAEAYTAAIACLTPSDDALAPDVYENLGLALYKQGRYDAAARALLRVLDGDLLARAQSLWVLVSCCFRGGKLYDGERLLTIYEAKFGEHPEGWQRHR